MVGNTVVTPSKFEPSPTKELPNEPDNLDPPTLELLIIVPGAVPRVPTSNVDTWPTGDEYLLHCHFVSPLNLP